MQPKTKTESELDLKTLRAGNDGAALGDGIIAEFDAVITSSREDRDGDVMEAKGANVDPKMPLLWQHDPQQPIGRFKGVTDRDNERVVGRFALADTELGRDALTLLKLGALRISHGFRPLEFEPRKSSNGFHVKAFEVVEASLVSVPANTDAVVTALNTGKFHSPVIKSWAASLQTKGVSTMPAATLTEEKVTTEAKTFSEDDVKRIVADTIKELGNANTADNGKPTLADVLGAAAKGNNGGIKVKAASEQYSRVKSIGKHVKTGEPMRDEFGREVETVSQVEFAKAGAFFKFLAGRAGISAPLSEHERGLLDECFADQWCGKSGSQWLADIPGSHIKALLSDSVSGGVEAVPFFFDSDLISFPLLTGELFPFVDLRSVPRGNSVQGASVGNPTVTWGTAEGTAISLFNTSSLIAEIGTTIHPVVAAIEVGRDFLADSAADVGRVLTENIGQALMAELDRIVPNGNGLSEPEGIFNASGTIAVNSDNGTSGPPTLADFETLLFAVGKQYRNPSMRCAFISNDTTYRRSRGIRVDPNTPTVNQTPVLGLNAINAYSTIDWPHRIQNDIANSKAAFGALAKYRMYRRQGMQLEWVTTGQELARKNLALLIVRARFGGQIVDSDSFSTMTDFQS